MQALTITNEQATELIRRYGSPLYVYDEAVLRRCCRDMRGLLPGYRFKAYYSMKANNNIELLKIIRQEGLFVDAMSPGEILVAQKAGFTPDEILCVCNNISLDEMRFAMRAGAILSLDSLSQLEMFAGEFPGRKVALRFNTERGAGHHEKVVTAGKNTKFGIGMYDIDKVKAILKQYDLTLAGITQHIGSLVLTPEPLADSMHPLLEVAMQFPGLEFIDMGGSFGVPYKPDEQALDLKALSAALSAVIEPFLEKYDNRDVCFRSEPGRYVVAESGTLLGTVQAVKENHGTVYVGTDMGFNVLQRPVMYGSYHHMVLMRACCSMPIGPVTIVGNICETGDILAKDRAFPLPQEGDVIAVMTAGAYGFSMASNYNCRLRPAEVLVEESGAFRLIRRRETLEDLLAQYETE